MKCHSTAVNANGFVLQFSFVQKCFKTKQPEVQVIEAPLQRFSLKSGVNFKPRFDICIFWASQIFESLLSAHLVKSPLGHHGVGRRHRHGHRNAPRRPSPPPSPPAAAASHPTTTTGSQVNTFLSLGRIGQNLPGSRIWGSQSGHPQPPHPDGPLQLFPLLLPPLPLCCSNCCSNCCYSGCSAAAARLTLEQPLLENKQDQLGFSLNHCILRSVSTHSVESGIKNSAKWSKVT